MIRALSILGLLVAVALPVLDYVVFRPRRAAAGVTVAMRRAEWLIHAAFLVALAGMALSGVAPLAFGEPMHGWLLIMHMALAPLFSVAIAALALLWTVQARPADARISIGEGLSSWLVVAAGFVTILSAMLGMMSWFGSDMQVVLLNVHRVGAIILIVAAACQAGRLLSQPAQPPLSA